MYWTRIQTTVDTQEATKVFSIARMVISSKPPSEPQLNPNHPTHSRAHPMNIIGTLWLLPLSVRELLRPIASAAATPEIPEHMWTTVPPAKSWTGRPNDVSPALRNPPPHTMCAMGV